MEYKCKFCDKVFSDGKKIEIDMKKLVNFSFIFIRGNVLREGRAQLFGDQRRGLL